MYFWCFCKSQLSNEDGNEETAFVGDKQTGMVPRKQFRGHVVRVIHVVEGRRESTNGASWNGGPPQIKFDICIEQKPDAYVQSQHGNNT